MAPLALVLLGGFGAALGSGGELRLPTRKARLLLARLALPPGQVHSRDDLTRLLWCDRQPAQARASLRQALTSLRKACGAAQPSPLRFSQDSLALDPRYVEIDVAQFEQLIAAGTTDDLRQAAALYRGPLLAGISIRDEAVVTWLNVERERLRDLYHTVLARLVDAAMAAERLQEAGDFARRLLRSDPLREDAHRALMRVYAHRGQRTRALRQFRLCAAILERQLAVEPEDETRRLHEQLRGNHPPSPAELVSLRPPPGTVPPEPVKPSIAVLPFDNLGGDPDERYFSDGITDDIITQLSRFPTLLVIARNSSFAYRGKGTEVATVARELGVHYVLDGSVRKAPDQIRINVQLIDGVTGHHIWSERYDSDLEDLFAVQDAVSQTIVATLAGRLEIAGRRRASRKSPDNLEAYDHVLRGNDCFYRFTRADTDEACARYRQAVQLDPRCARGHLGLAWAGLVQWICHWTDRPQQTFTDAFQSARTALALDDSDSLTHAILAELYLFRGEYEQASIHVDRALLLNPNDADAIGINGFILTCRGRPVEAIQRFANAKRLNPYQPDWCMFCWRFGIAHYTAEQYDKAIKCMQEIVSPINDVRGWLAASYAQAGRLDDAQAAMIRFLEGARRTRPAIHPDDLDAWRERWSAFVPYEDPADFTRFFDGLCKAGLR